VGLGVGLLAGIERYFLGGFVAESSALATVLLGLYAGTMLYFRPQWTKSALSLFGVVVVGTVLKYILMLSMVQPLNDAIELVKAISIPTTVLNISGCVLFIWLMSDLDRDRLENEAEEARLLALQAEVERDRQGQLAQQSELRALRAQVDPHFLNNTLNDLIELIFDYPEKARLYVGKLADFFNYTREFAGRNTISLQQELEQLQRYLDLQRLGLEDKLQENIDIPPDLWLLQVLPGCLLILVENALKHAFKGQAAPYNLKIYAVEKDTNLILSVRDNGIGVAPERLAKLGKTPVQSLNKGGGVALYHLGQSLVLEFGEAAKMNIECNDKGTIVSLIQPTRSAI
ncbi:MAG: histidine kinase, partial [Methylococcaceae bacterium]|nr:histidine kinase [Methylococcaceae bacterium]